MKQINHNKVVEQSNSEHEPKDRSPLIENPDLYKSVFDFLKHMTTLSTGSIVLITTIDKLFVQPSWTILIGIALIGFVTSIIASMIAFHTGLLMFPGRLPSAKNDKENLVRARHIETLLFVSNISFFFTWTGFLVGISLVAAFTFLNLLGN